MSVWAGKTVTANCLVVQNFLVSLKPLNRPSLLLNFPPSSLHLLQYCIASVKNCSSPGLAGEVNIMADGLARVGFFRSSN